MLSSSRGQDIFEDMSEPQLGGGGGGGEGGGASLNKNFAPRTAQHAHPTSFSLAAVSRWWLFFLETDRKLGEK